MQSYDCQEAALAQIGMGRKRVMESERAKHVLIGEGEGHARLTLSLVLRKAGFNVTSASNGREVLKRVHEFAEGPEAIDLLLLDLQMPGLMGLDLITELNHLPPSCTVLVMSGDLDEEIVAEAMRGGCVGYLEKPFEPEDLLCRVKWAFDKAIQPRRKERTMSETLRYRGLCSTCNHVSDCAPEKTEAFRSVAYCEEFDAFQPPPRKSAPLDSRRATDNSAPDSRVHQGLCINCNLRATCLNATSEGGVWHCENYE